MVLGCGGRREGVIGCWIRLLSLLEKLRTFGGGGSARGGGVELLKMVETVVEELPVDSMSGSV